MTSHLLPTTRMTLSPNLCLASLPARRPCLSTRLISPFVGSSLSTQFSGVQIRPASLNPSSYSTSGAKRGVVTMVIPFSRGSARDQPPPDLPSYFHKNRIVYLGMPLVPSVVELLIAQFYLLERDDPDKPIYLYINSTGTTKGDVQLGYEKEAFTIYDIMGCIEPPVFTLCVGNAWGDASMLLAAGARGNRAALPSATIMMKEPISRFQGQVSDVELKRKYLKNIKDSMVDVYALHTGKTRKEIEEDLRRPKYFSPSEAVEYGIIDKVLYNERGREDRGVLSELKRSNLI